MRKTLATLAVLSAVALAGCSGSHQAAPTAPPSSPAVASSEPSADVSGEVAPDSDATADVTDLKVTSAEANGPGVVRIEFTAVNSGNYACTFGVTVGIFDSTGTQVQGIQGDSSELGPTKPGARIHVSGLWAAVDNKPLPHPFTAKLIKAERAPA